MWYDQTFTTFAGKAGSSWQQAGSNSLLHKCKVGVQTKRRLEFCFSLTVLKEANKLFRANTCTCCDADMICNWLTSSTYDKTKPIQRIGADRHMKYEGSHSLSTK